MANWFEDVTKTLGDEKIGRRTALRRVAGSVVGMALASTISGLALAKTNKQCPHGGYTCSQPQAQNCVGNPNMNCFCFTQFGGKAVCGCNGFCSQFPSCTSPSTCSKGYVCIVNNGCDCSSSVGVCVPKCKGKNKNCQLGSGHGATAAGRVL